MKDRTRAFTLIELLVVVAIIALLIGILVPSLAAARDKARSAVCGTHLRAICQGLNTYAADYGAFPPAYFYFGQTLDNNVNSPANGYIHWSSFLFNGVADESSGNVAATNNLAVGSLPAKLFLCPEFADGGLVPENPGPKGFPLPGGFISPYPSTTDEQAPRIAYTVNEAICGRNKWFKGYASAGDPSTQRPYRFVRPSEIDGGSSVILATEFTTNSNVISNNPDDNGNKLQKSHRPVHGFTGNPPPTDPCDVYAVAASFKGGGLSRVVPGTQYYDYLKNMNSIDDHGLNLTRLAWVGRNHGGGGWKSKKSNFGYVDGHVELKPVLDTLKPFEWGQRFYSLRPGEDIDN